jgi:hypothetical protein
VAAGFDADVPTAGEPVDADEVLDVDSPDAAEVPTAASVWAAVADPGGVVSDASPPAVIPVSWDSAEVEVPASTVVPGAPWERPGLEWLPLNGTTPVEAPTTVMVSAAVVVATASLAIDPSPANLANRPVKNPVPNIVVPSLGRFGSTSLWSQLTVGGSWLTPGKGPGNYLDTSGADRPVVVARA